MKADVMILQHRNSEADGKIKVGMPKKDKVVMTDLGLSQLVTLFGTKDAVRYGNNEDPLWLSVVPGVVSRSAHSDVPVTEV